MKSLEVIYMVENALTGTITSNIGKLAHLEWLSLANNSLSGTFPAELENLENLVEIQFLCFISNKIFVLKAI